MSNSGSILDKINELISDLKAEGALEIKISKEDSVEISTGESDEIIAFLDALPNLEGLTQEELVSLLDECEAKLEQMEQDEPDEEDEDAYDDWEEQYFELEDKIEEIRDLLDDMNE